MVREPAFIVIIDIQNLNQNFEFNPYNYYIYNDSIMCYLNLLLKKILLKNIFKISFIYLFLHFLFLFLFLLRKK